MIEGLGVWDKLAIIGLGIVCFLAGVIFGRAFKGMEQDTKLQKGVQK